MKNKLYQIGAYIFGAVAICSLGLYLGASTGIHSTWQTGDTYFAVMFGATVVALRLNWITP